MSQSSDITIHNRYSNQKEIEKVYGDSMVKFAYNTKVGKLLGKIIASRSLSQMYGAFQDTNLSKKKVVPFIKDFDIPIEDYKKGSLKNAKIEDSYKSFNEFFVREFQEGKREFSTKENEMGAFAEARYYGHASVSDDLIVPVKGSQIKALDLIGDEKWAKIFTGGPFLIARLCPVDYHRYHYPLAGTTLDSYHIHGDFHSVNPLALKYRQDILIKNERRVSILETKEFGKLAYIEVGATCVGKIVQSFDESTPFSRGDEKGYFLFGGSTVIVYGEPGRWTPSQDILANTQNKTETYIHLGDSVAQTL